MAILLIAFSGLLLMWIGEWPWWISLPVAIVLFPLPVFSAFWPVSYTPNPRVAATIVIAFWILLEVFTLIAKGLTLPWHQDVIRFLIDIAAITGATWAGLGRSPREFVRVITRPIAISRSNQKSMPQSEATPKERPEKKSMVDIIADGLNKMTPEEWQEHCRKSDAEDDLALGRSAPDQPQVKAKLQPIFPPNTAHADRPPLSKEEQKQRVDVLEKLVDLEELKKNIEVRRKGLLERLNQVPRRN